MPFRPGGAVAGLLIVACVLVSCVCPAWTAFRDADRSSRETERTTQPQVLVLQPDGANGTDTFIVDASPWSTFGTNGSLFVGRDSVNGSVARSLLRFDLGTLPPNATIVNASLELYSNLASNGTVDVHRASRPWLEGSEGDPRWQVPVTVRETAGVPRTLEPVAAVLSFNPFEVGDPARDVRVWDGPQETPSQIYGYVVAGGTAGHWKLDDGAGTTAADASGKGNTGTLVGGPVWTTGTLNGALNFDGVDDTVSIANESNFDFERTNAFSYGLWLKPDTADTSIQTPITKMTDASPWTGWELSTNLGNLAGDPGKLAIDLISTWTSNAIRVYTTNDTNLNDGNWHHYVVTYDGSSAASGIKLYEDGASLALTVIYNSLSASILNNAPVVLGARTSPLDYWYNGLIDDVHIYNRTLNAADVASLFKEGGSVVQATTYFGATVGANGTKTFFITYSANGTSVPGYRTKGFEATPLWTSPPVGLGASSPTVVDLLRDGSLEIIYGTSDGFVHALDGNGQLVWSVGNLSSVPFPPQVRDVDRDGKLDVVAVTMQPSIVRINETGTANPAWTILSTPRSPPTLLDVNGDGSLEALIATDSTVQAYSLSDGSLLQAYSGTINGTAAPSIADLNGDALPEIVFGGEDSKIHVFAPSGAELYTGPANNTVAFRNSMAIGDLTGDGLPEVVTADNASPARQLAWDPRTNNTIWSVGLLEAQMGHQTLADVNADGVPDVLFGTSTGGIHALNGSGATFLWSQTLGLSQPSSPAVADLDRDGSPDIVFLSRQGSEVSVLNATGVLTHGWAITPNDPGGSPSYPEFVTPAIADVNGDGTLEVIVPTGSGVVAFATGSLARDWRTFGYNWNHTHLVGDGSSPEGVPRLDIAVGTPSQINPSGASWNSFDGVQLWTSAGGDYGTLEDSVPAGAGWLGWNVTSAVTDWQGGFANTGFLLREPDEATGERHTFPSSDSISGNLRPVLRITFNLPPFDPGPHIVGSIQNFARPEDSAPWFTSLSGLAVDADTPLSSLLWNVSGYDPHVVLITGINTQGNHVLTFYPQPNAWGSMLVTYWLSDPEGNTANQEAWINITPVNDAPRFSPPATLVVKHDRTYDFDFAPYIEDIDDPTSALTLTSDDPNHTNVSNFVVSFLFPISFVDQWAFVGLIVSDGQAFVGKVVAVKVTRDDPPVLTRALPDVTIQEGTTIIGVFDLDAYFLDPNNDTLFFSYGYTHLTIVIHANHSVDISAESDWFGAERVTFRGTDPHEALAEDTIVVTVLPVNDPPILGPIPDLRVHYDADYTFNVEPYLSDPDTPLESIVVTTSSAYVAIRGRILSLRYPLSLNGTTQGLTILASDGTSTASRTVLVTVGDDWPPILVRELGDRAFLEDGSIIGAYDLRTFFEDPDDQTLYFSSGNVNVLVSISSAMVNLFSVANWSGAERVTFRATDGLGALAEDTVSIVVLPVNDPPAFRGIPTQYLNTSAGVLDLTTFLLDVDTNLSDLSVTVASENVTVVGRTLIFHYRTDAYERLEVVANDGFLEARTFVEVVVRFPKTTERLPPFVWWLLGIGGGTAAVAAAAWRYRRVEWVFLVTSGGMLRASVGRRGSVGIDTDLMAGMMTAIMDFAKVSFSDDKPRELDQFSLGDRRVELVRGKHGYLAAVYTGRTPGRLTKIMESLLGHIEQRYPGAFGDFVDTSAFQDIPVLLKRLIDRAWWPFLSFPSRGLQG